MLIDAHKLLDDIGNMGDNLFIDSLKLCISELIDKQINEFGEQIVRCKDCNVPHNKWTGCPKMNGIIMQPNDFCSYGERKQL